MSIKVLNFNICWQLNFKYLFQSLVVLLFWLFWRCSLFFATENQPFWSVLRSVKLRCCSWNPHLDHLGWWTSYHSIPPSCSPQPHQKPHVFPAKSAPGSSWGASHPGSLPWKPPAPDAGAGPRALHARSLEVLCVGDPGHGKIMRWRGFRWICVICDMLDMFIDMCSMCSNISRTGLELYLGIFSLLLDVWDWLHLTVFWDGLLSH